MKTPIYSPLKWEAEYNEHDNTVWSAPSCSGTEEGDLFYYRLTPMLRADKIVWFETSDAELGIIEGLEYPWENLEEAKTSIEESNKRIWDQALADGSLTCMDDD